MKTLFPNDGPYCIMTVKTFTRTVSYRCHSQDRVNLLTVFPAPGPVAFWPILAHIV